MDGYIVEVSVLHVGIAINATTNFPGSVCDLENFQNMDPLMNWQPVKSTLKKRKTISDCFLNNIRMNRKLHMMKDNRLFVKSSIDYICLENQPVVRYL